MFFTCTSTIRWFISFSIVWCREAGWRPHVEGLIQMKLSNCRNSLVKFSWRLPFHSILISNLCMLSKFFLIVEPYSSMPYIHKSYSVGLHKNVFLQTDKVDCVPNKSIIHLSVIICVLLSFLLYMGSPVQQSIQGNRLIIWCISLFYLDMT